MPLQPAFRPGTRIALMDKFGTPWSGHGENLPVAFTGRNKNHGSFDHSPGHRLRWFPSSSLGTQSRKLQLPEQLTTTESPQSNRLDRHNYAHWNSANVSADPRSPALRDCDECNPAFDA